MKTILGLKKNQGWLARLMVDFARQVQADQRSKPVDVVSEALDQKQNPNIYSYV